MTESNKVKTNGIHPGVCVPWEEKVKEFGEILGNAEIVKKEWEQLDAMAYAYLWFWVHR